MKYWQRRSMIMKLLGYIAMAGVFVCLAMGLAYFSILLMLFSFYFSNESELCKLRGIVEQLILNQNATIGVEFNSDKEANK